MWEYKEGDFIKDLSNENIIHIKKDNVEYLQFKKLNKYSDILTHCFTLRELDFKGFNDYKENKDFITENYNKICNALDLKYEYICRPNQTHTKNVKCVYEGDEGIYLDKFKNVDALVTNKKNKALVLAFADCMPLVFFDPIKKVIANTHSGWRGTLKRISEETVKCMIKEYNSNPENIICLIGPTIRKCHFEVDKDVKDLFYNEFKNLENIDNYITKQNEKEKYNIDAVQINKQMLLDLGLKQKNIIDSKICTVCNKDKIHSYRADKENSGRNIMLICLK